MRNDQTSVRKKNVDRSSWFIGERSFEFLHFSSNFHRGVSFLVVPPVFVVQRKPKGKPPFCGRGGDTDTWRPHTTGDLRTTAGSRFCSSAAPRSFKADELSTRGCIKRGVYYFIGRESASDPLKMGSWFLYLVGRAHFKGAIFFWWSLHDTLNKGGL